MQLDELLKSYALENDIGGTTIEYYGRVVRVFNAWANRQPSPPPFNAATVSLFLLEMQQAGKSAYYRRSLRSGLVALLRFSGDAGRVRPVRVPDLDNEAWTPDEVSKLIAHSKDVPPRDDPTYWPTIIAAACYTGLSQCDLERLERSHVRANGTVITRRSKTGKKAVTWMPPELLESRPEKGPLWKRRFSNEMFRRHFKSIVAAAGLHGTFKRLRKTSGAEIERLYPGKGHIHLANTRAVFERHYLPSAFEPEPFQMPTLPAVG